MKHILAILIILSITACTYEPFTPRLIQTTAPTKITAYSASIGGERLAISHLDEAGVVFAEHPNPDLNDCKVMCITEARDYITNKYITVYGNTVIFKTLSPP